MLEAGLAAVIGDDLDNKGIKINWVQNCQNKSPDSRNLGFFVPNFVVTCLGVEPRTYRLRVTYKACLGVVSRVALFSSLA